MFQVNHIHLKAPDPKKTAQWYTDMFGAKIVADGERLVGSQTVRLDIEGTRINATCAPAGQSLPQSAVESHYRLEHFGLDRDDIERVMARIESRDVDVLLPTTCAASGNIVSYTEGTDKVRIELVQSNA